MAFRDPETAERMIRENLAVMQAERDAIGQQIARLHQRDAELAAGMEQWSAVLADEPPADEVT